MRDEMCSMLKSLQLFSIALILSACAPLCGEEILKSKPSPDGENVMIWHSRDCGTTTIPKMTVYVVPEIKTKTMVSESPKIANRYKIASFERLTLDAFWMSNNSIKIEYDATPRFGRVGHFFVKNNSVSDIKIEYVDTTP